MTYAGQPVYVIICVCHYVYISLTYTKVTYGNNDIADPANIDAQILGLVGSIRNNINKNLEEKRQRDKKDAEES